MKKIASVYLRRIDDGDDNGSWTFAARTDPNGVYFRQASTFDELRAELGTINPETLTAFYEDGDRWEKASWEVRAQYYEFMAGATRMFAPKED